MIGRTLRLHCGIALGVMATAAAAQDPQATTALPQASASATDTTGVMPESPPPGAAGEIIVTARRREESLQDVPQTINAVTGNTLEKLNIQRFEDVQAIVPGLTLSSGNNGFSTAATIRGASFSVESGASPTVEFYLNDALLQSQFVFQSLFDVGQIEVLRGPQGTLRGRASPSGSITVTTRRPDLAEVGGYAQMTGTTKGGINANAAVNVPLVADKLAVRLAGIVDHNRGDFITSVRNRADPYSQLEALRGSVRFEPADFVSANVVYQHLRRDLRSYDGVESLSLSDPSVAATNPIIDASDRLGLTRDARGSLQKQDLVTGNLNLRLGGQQLTYVGSYSAAETAARSTQDYADLFPLFDIGQNTDNDARQYTHELRLSSEERLFDFLDYTVGVFNSDYRSTTDVTQRTMVALLGRPMSVSVTPIVTTSGQKETSFFGNLTAHIGERTELSGGLRYIIFKDFNRFAISGAPLLDDRSKSKPVVYNASISHRFSDSFLAYANTGSSWRYGPFLVGLFRPLTPRLSSFVSLGPEKSTSYEAGFKTNLLDNRLRINVAAFHQKFDGFIYRGPLVNYVDVTATGNRVQTFNFGANVDAKIKGVDLDAAFQITPRFSIGGAFSYAKGKIDDQFVACNDANGDGVPDGQAGTPTVAQLQAGSGGEAVAQCRVSDRLSFAPNWSLTLQSELSQPVSDRVDGYARGLLTYYPKNVNDPNNDIDNVQSYGLANLYVGIRDPRGGWEVSLFAKNITNTGVTLDRSNVPRITSYQALQPPTFRTALGTNISSGYVSTRYTAPREFGLNIRYAFGSR